MPAPAHGGPPAPSLRVRTNALQSLCRQVIGARLAVIAVGVPFALRHATDGLPRALVLTASVLSLMGSYAVLRDWDRVGPRVLRHPTLLGLDLALASVLLLTASPDSPLGYATVATPLLAGLLYGWRWAALFTATQLGILLTVFRAWDPESVTVSATLLIGGFCVAAGVLGATLRTLVFRVVAASAALAETGERLAVAEALSTERARLAREMHDTVAKTLHGVALAAEALATTDDPATVRREAALVARSARRAATESRTLLADLRRRTDTAAERPEDAEVNVREELALLLAEFTDRTGTPTTLTPRAPAPNLPAWTAGQLLQIAGEGLENAHRHASATRVEIAYGLTGTGVLRLTVRDDGRGLPPGLSLKNARREGHFGLLGMAERAQALGGALRIGRPERPAAGPGTEIHLELPLPHRAPACVPPPGEEAAHAVPGP
ncbi:histidine kinase [Streptomyces sp. NPDC049954]|uniref:sensor histidine kinase n=1 Tax=Streptomyces sp. NPDC049954 TaxID=3155779 RepID=UPI0034342996